MGDKISIKLTAVLIGILFAFFPTPFALAQSDGAAPSDGSVPSASDTGSAPVPTETAAPLEASPRAAPATTSAEAVSAPAPSSETLPRDTGTSAPKPVVPSEVAPAPEISPASLPESVIPESMPESPAPFPYAFVAFGIVILLAPYGMYCLLRNTKDKKPKDEQGGRCDDIKKLLERKKSTLEIVTGTLSLQQALVELLEKKIEEKKEEIQDDIKYEVVDKAAGEEAGKVARQAEEVKETYDELVEKLETAKRAIAYFTNQKKRLGEDAGKIESAYQTCLLGDSVFTGASHFGRGLELFEDSFNQKLYRYTSAGEGIFSIGKRSLPKELMKEANEARKWLPRPELPEGEYSFFFTAKGKEAYEKTLLSVHKKYLPDIRCEEVEFAHIGEVAYEDEWQAVAKQTERK